MPLEYNPEDEEPKVWPSLPTTLWNHMAEAIESVPNDHMFFFGGQKAPREFSNAVNVMECVHDEAGNLSLAWETKWTLAGTPPPAREDSGCCYDPSTCNLLFFGGWRQKWWNDLSLLNVAGVVGPPYAVMSTEPNTGPLTGGTPITLHGLRFKNSTLVSVRFTDGKKFEATVSGQYVSENELVCKSPDFSKFGAFDVVVRVSIGGEAYTVNETYFSYYANTSAAKCICFGPGLRQGNQAGQLHKFMVQAKDVAGKLRTTGDDPIDVTLSGPAQDLIEKAHIEDLKNGMYVVSFFVPAAGKYEMSVGVDENPYDDEIIFTTIRGFPVNLSFDGAWKSLQVSGDAAKLKVPGYVRFFSDGEKVYCFIKDDAKDTGLPDLASEKALGFEKEPPKEVVEGEEGAEAEEEEPEPEPEPEDPPPEAAAAPAAEGGEPPAEVIEKAPDMVYILDPATGVWSSMLLSESPVPEPDFIKLRDANIAALSKMGIPDVLVRAMYRPNTVLEDWSIEGVSGKCPTARGGWQLVIVKDKLYVYGGWVGEGKNRTYLDDVFQLDMQAKTWTQIFRCHIDDKLAAGRWNVMVPGATAPLIVAMSKGVVGDSLEVVDTLDVGPMIDPKRGDFKDTMTAHVKEQLDELNKIMMKANQELALGAKLQAGDIPTLKKVMTALKKVKDDGVNLQFTLDQLGETLAYMKTQNMGKLDAHERKLNDVNDALEAAMASAGPTRKLIKPLQDEEASRVIAELLDKEEVFAKQHAKMLQTHAFKYERGTGKAYGDLSDLSGEVMQSELECERLLQLAKLFEFPDKADQIKETCTTMRGDLVKSKALWDLTFMVEAQIEVSKGLLWDDIQPSSLEEESKAFQKIVKGMDKSVRMWDVYSGVDGTVKNFLVSVPAVSELKSPAMRQRHWDKLMEITGATLPVIDGKFAPEFCLANLLALQLHKYVDDVGEVVDQANKEDKMEQTLKKLDETWKVVDFGFDKHQDTDVYLINLAEENFEMLEENQLIVQGMMASKFLATFEEWVTGWQKKLSSVSDILAQMQDTQRKWAYLETLFIGSDEVKKELPEDAERFAKVDVLFKEMLKHFKNMPNCVDSCAKPGLLKGLEAIADDLELCEKALADFLEQKRTFFPRFYFVSQTMLLDILSNGNRPWVVLKNVNAMMQGVKEMSLEGDPAVTVVSMTSNEGEVVPFKITGNLKCEGKVESYLTDTISKMRHEMRGQLGDSIQDYDKTGKAGKDRPAWIKNKHCAQLSLVVTQQQWTVKTDEVFDKIEGGQDYQVFRDYYAFQLEMLSGMIEMVQGDLEKLHRRAAMNVITLEAHSRDINKKMIGMGVDRKDHFEWLGQLKTRWEKHVGHAGQTPELDQGQAYDAVLYICDALFRYSFKYLGASGRLVITPLTDRIYITATQSAHLILGCAPQGPAGTGKTESTKDLSAQLGKTVYVFNCGPEMDYLTMRDIFKGLASSGSWGCFDEFNRLIAEVLSVCTIQWKSVLDGMRAGGDYFRFDGIETYLHPDGCCSFITMNPGYLGRQELPESLKVLFR